MPIINIVDSTFTYYPIPKNASTSIKRWIYDYFCSFNPGFEMFVKERFDCYEKALVHSIFPRPKKDGGCINDRYKPTFKFAVVRDPVSRFISAYKNRILNERCLSKYKDQLSKKGLSPVPNINEYIKNLESYRSISTEVFHHSATQHVFVGNILTRLDKVYDIYETKKLEQDLENITGYKLEFKHLKVSSSKSEIGELTEESKRFLLSYTEKDYEMLAAANVKFNKYNW